MGALIGLTPRALTKAKMTEDGATVMVIVLTHYSHFKLGT